jgi:hypothetical protein
MTRRRCCWIWRLPSGWAVQGLTGAAAGAAAGGAAGAAAYGLGCRSSTAGCTWTGLAAATGETAAGGAITGAAFATAGGALSSAAAAAPRGNVAPEAGINEGVNSVSNIGAGAATRSAATIARAEPGSAFSGVYDPVSGRLSAYPSVADPAAPGAPVNAVLSRGGHGQINRAVFGALIPL